MAKEMTNENVQTEVETNEPAVEQNAQEPQAKPQQNEPTAEERKEMVEEFNKLFSDYATLRTVECDSPEAEAAREAAKKMFDEAVDGFTDMKLTVVEDPELALKYASLLKLWNEKMTAWSNKEWVGVVHFDEVLAGIIDELEKNPGALVLDVSTLMFAFNAIKEPKGVGLETARFMKSIDSNPDTNDDAHEGGDFTALLNAVIAQVRYIEKLNKKATILNQCVAMANHDYVIDLKCKELDDFVAFHDAMVAGAGPR